MRGNRLFVLLAVLAGVLALLAVGCGGDDEAAPPAEPATETEAPAEETTEPPAEEPAEETTEEPATPAFELRVGVVTSLTGDLAPFGVGIDNGTRLAADLANAALASAGLTDVSVAVVASEDDQTDATAGVEAATKLVQSDGVQVIVGSLASSVTIPIAESVSIPNKVIQISPASTAIAISDIADDGMLWRTPPSDAAQAPILAAAVAEAFGADATINVGARNDAYGVGLADGFEAEWQALGGTVGASVRWNPEAATFDTEAQQLAGGEPDGWVIVDFPETWAKMGPALVRAGGWDPARTFSTDGLRDKTLPETGGAETTEGMRGTAPSSGGDTPGGDAFAAAFAAAYPDQEQQLFDANAFDAVMVAFLAALQAGSADTTAISENMQAISGPPGLAGTFEDLDALVAAILAGEDIDYQGAAGTIDFDEKGDVSADGALYELWQFEGGELKTLSSVVFEG